MLVRAYFDDSGSDRESKVFLLGGLLGLAEPLDALDVEWKALLKKYALDYFKASEWKACDGQFSGWQYGQRHAACCLEFADLIIQHPLAGIAYGTTLDSIVRAFPDVPGITVADLYPILFMYAVIDVDRTGVQRNATRDGERWEAIHCIFDNQPGNGYLPLSFPRFMGARLSMIASTSFADSKKVRQLQACDLFAWSHRRDILHGDKKSTAVFKTLSAMSGDPFQLMPNVLRGMLAPFLGLPDEIPRGGHA